MILHHFGTEVLGPLRQAAQGSTPTHKPIGLWLSDESDEMSWSSWCEGEQWGLDGLAVCTAVEVDPARVLHVASEPELVAFHRQYSVDVYAGSRSIHEHELIDWAAVAGTGYDGILISPYRWEWRLARPISAWYYGWDCASACIWNPAACVTVLGEAPANA